jgi:hypothetical protein
MFKFELHETQQVQMPPPYWAMTPPNPSPRPSVQRIIFEKRRLNPRPGPASEPSEPQARQPPTQVQMA